MVYCCAGNAESVGQVVHGRGPVEHAHPGEAHVANAAEQEDDGIFVWIGDVRVRVTVIIIRVARWKSGGVDQRTLNSD